MSTLNPSSSTTGSSSLAPGIPLPPPQDREPLISDILHHQHSLDPSQSSTSGESTSTYSPVDILISDEKRKSIHKNSRSFETSEEFLDTIKDIPKDSQALLVKLTHYKEDWAVGHEFVAAEFQRQVPNAAGGGGRRFYVRFDRITHVEQIKQLSAMFFSSRSNVEIDYAMLYLASPEDVQASEEKARIALRKQQQAAGVPIPKEPVVVPPLPFPARPTGQKPTREELDRAEEKREGQMEEAADKALKEKKLKVLWTKDYSKMTSDKRPTLTMCLRTCQDVSKHMARYSLWKANCWAYAYVLRFAIPITLLGVIKRDEKLFQSEPGAVKRFLGYKGYKATVYTIGRPPEPSGHIVSLHDGKNCFAVVVLGEVDEYEDSKPEITKMDPQGLNEFLTSEGGMWFTCLSQEWKNNVTKKTYFLGVGVEINVRDTVEEKIGEYVVENILKPRDDM